MKLNEAIIHLLICYFISHPMGLANIIDTKWCQIFSSQPVSAGFIIYNYTVSPKDAFAHIIG